MAEPNPNKWARTVAQCQCCSRRTHLENVKVLEQVASARAQDLLEQPRGRFADKRRIHVDAVAGRDRVGAGDQAAERDGVLE